MIDNTKYVVVDDMINATSNALARLYNFTNEDPKNPSKLVHLLNSYYKLLWVFHEDLSQFIEKGDKDE